MSHYAHHQPWAKGLETLCLKKMKDCGGTANAREIAQAVQQPIENVSPRLNELSRAGLIRDTGGRESVGRGRPLIIWTVTDAGWDCFTGKDIAAAKVPAPAPKTEQLGFQL